jgi:hypothetical protein
MALHPVESHYPETLAHVIAALDASIELGRRPGLRASVHQRLLNILEAALELAREPGGEVDKAAPLVLRLDDYEVTYSLDLDNACVHVLYIQPFDDRPIPADRAFSRNLLRDGQP